MMMKAGKAEVTTKLATYRFCRDVKRLAARMLDAGKEKQLEEMLRIVATRLQEHGMNDAAAVTAAAVMGIDVDPACPGDIARRLLTRLLLAGKKPRVSPIQYRWWQAVLHYYCSMKRIALTVKLSYVTSADFTLP